LTIPGRQIAAEAPLLIRELSNVGQPAWTYTDKKSRIAAKQNLVAFLTTKIFVSKVRFY
jgi:hypothetical protein